MSTDPTDPGNPIPAPRRPRGLRTAAGLAVIGSLGAFLVVILVLIWVAAEHMQPPASELKGAGDDAGQSSS